MGSVPYLGAERWPQVDRVAALTTVTSGVVYVPLDTGSIVWEGWQHQLRVIGQVPWSLGEDEHFGWDGRRHIVGNPEYDVVTWVERDRALRVRGDVVVVEASTGAELARATIEVPAERDVVIVSIDAQAVYFAAPTPHPEQDFSVDGADVWVWTWAAGGIPQPSGRPAGQRILDVSGGVWAVDTGPTLRFEDGTGRRLSEIPASYQSRTTLAFGRNLSPDGRFWYAPAHEGVVDTATGELVHITVGVSMSYGWTGPAELTVIAGVYNECDAITASCTQALNRRPDGPYSLPSY